MKPTTWPVLELSVSELQSVAGGIRLPRRDRGVSIDGDWGYVNEDQEWSPETLPIGGTWFNFPGNGIIQDDGGNGGWGIG
jgi:hypothetical protein